MPTLVNTDWFGIDAADDSVNVNAGTLTDNGYAVVGIVHSSPPTTIAVTWGGVSMTSLGKAFDGMELFGLVNPAGGASVTVAVDTNAADNVGVAVWATFTGVHQTTPVRDADFTQNDDLNDITSPSITSDSGDLAVSFAKMIAGTMTPSDSSIINVPSATHGYGFFAVGLSSKAGASPSISFTWTTSGTSGTNGIVAVSLQSAALVDLEGTLAVTETSDGVAVDALARLALEGFRFRNDNGSESAATWLAAQDSNVNIALDTSFRLRFLIDAANNPPPKGYRILYKKTTESTWRDLQ